MGEFSDIIRMCVDFGITEFELSPTVGEAFMDPHINERIDKIASYDSVKKIKIFTNLLREGPIFKALECPKVELNVSIYGNNQKVYKARTGRDMYWLFLKNFRTLIEHINDHKELRKQIILYKRFKGDLPKPNLRDFNDFSRWMYYAQLLNIERYDSSGDTNWGKMLKHNSYVMIEDKSRDGICKYAVEDNAVFVGGNISFCGWFDADRRMIIGNIHKTPLKEIYSLDSLYMKWLKLQEGNHYFGMCSDCRIHSLQSTKITLEEIYGNHVSDDG
jgi:hypothetical protein